MMVLQYPDISIDWSGVSDDDRIQILNQSCKTWHNFGKRLADKGNLPARVKEIYSAVFFRHRMLELDNEVPVTSWVLSHNPHRMLAYLVCLRPLISEAHDAGIRTDMDSFDVDIAIDALIDILAYADTENLMPLSYSHKKFRSEAAPMWNDSKQEIDLFYLD